VYDAIEVKRRYDLTEWSPHQLNQYWSPLYQLASGRSMRDHWWQDAARCQLGYCFVVTVVPWRRRTCRHLLVTPYPAAAVARINLPFSLTSQTHSTEVHISGLQPAAVCTTLKRRSFQWHACDADRSARSLYVSHHRYNITAGLPWRFLSHSVLTLTRLLFNGRTSSPSKENHRGLL